MSDPLVVGDVHGCAEELEELLILADPEQVVLVGDLFTKGPSPARLWRLLRPLIATGRLRSVLGNHDDRLLDAMDGHRPHDKHALRVVSALDREDPDWRTWLRGLPLYERAEGYLVVHAGLHPSGDLAQTRREQALTLRRWPDERPQDPHWWQIYTGSQPVIYGHDAMRGLVRVERGGKPLIMGLDSGCVYGGKLTGWFPAQDRLVQVRARARYR